MVTRGWIHFSNNLTEIGAQLTFMHLLELWRHVVSEHPYTESQMSNSVFPTPLPFKNPIKSGQINSAWHIDKDFGENIQKGNGCTLLRSNQLHLL